MIITLSNTDDKISTKSLTKQLHNMYLQGV